MSALRYLRVSVTSACGLGCVYCSGKGVRPPDVKGSDPFSGLLTPAHIERVVRVAQGLGVTHVRLTGGEPLDRPEIVEIVQRLGRLGLDDLSLTTNGVRLAELALALKTAGLVRVNVNLPHIDRRGYERITRADALADVLAGLRAARAAGLVPVKTNTVVLRGLNDAAVADLVEFGRQEGVLVRFIEYMSADAASANGWFVPAGEVVAQLAARFGVAENVAENVPGTFTSRVPGTFSAAYSAPCGPARYWQLRGGAVVGIIAPVTEPFCGQCNRLRLTAAGALRPCLYGRSQVDLAPLLENGAPDEVLAAAIRRAAGSKPATHGDRLPSPMRLIGG